MILRPTGPQAHIGTWRGDAGDKSHWHSPHLASPCPVLRLHCVTAQAYWILALPYNCHISVPYYFYFTQDTHPRGFSVFLIISITSNQAPWVHQRNVSWIWALPCIPEGMFWLSSFLSLLSLSILPHLLIIYTPLMWTILPIIHHLIPCFKNLTTRLPTNVQGSSFTLVLPFLH